MTLTVFGTPRMAAVILFGAAEDRDSPSGVVAPGTEGPAQASDEKRTIVMAIMRWSGIGASEDACQSEPEVIGHYLAAKYRARCAIQNDSAGY
jgi:hypothetical protein